MEEKFTDRIKGGQLLSIKSKIRNFIFKYFHVVLRKPNFTLLAALSDGININRVTSLRRLLLTRVLDIGFR